MQRHMRSMLASRAEDWPHPAALTSPLLQLSAFRLYANKSRGWRERKAEACFVIKCMQYLSCCCYIMFGIRPFADLTSCINLESGRVCISNKRRRCEELRQNFPHSVLRSSVDEFEGRAEKDKSRLNAASWLSSPGEAWQKLRRWCKS